MLYQSVNHKYLWHKITFQSFLRILQTIFFQQFFIFWEFKQFSIFTAIPRASQPKRVSENIYIVMVTFRNLSIWAFDLQSNIFFLVFIFKIYVSNVSQNFLQRI